MIGYRVRLARVEAKILNELARSGACGHFAICRQTRLPARLVVATIRSLAARGFISTVGDGTAFLINDNGKEALRMTGMVDPDVERIWNNGMYAGEVRPAVGRVTPTNPIDEKVPDTPAARAAAERTRIVPARRATWPAVAIGAGAMLGVIAGADYLLGWF